MYLFSPGPDQDPVCSLASLCPLTHTHTGWERLKALPKTTQLEGCTLHSNPGLSASKTCVFNHGAPPVCNRPLLTS